MLPLEIVHQIAVATIFSEKPAFVLLGCSFDLRGCWRVGVFGGFFYRLYFKLCHFASLIKLGIQDRYTIACRVKIARRKALLNETLAIERLGLDQVIWHATLVLINSATLDGVR
ncbi:MAG: hypothetical protein CME84_05920 [Henriciella sp.]|nr:hypothetical protein [Henriciella sp.]